MTTTIKIALVAALLLGGLFLLAPRTAPCATCWTGECWNSASCGYGCVCLKRGMDLSGYCYSAEARVRVPPE
jgi:hypothetical protein